MSKKLTFPRKCSLSNKAEYNAVFNRSLKTSEKCLLLLAKKKPQQNARLGTIVGRKVAKSAVVRNRIKRILRESFRHQQDKLKGLDVVVIAKQSCDALSKAEIRKGIDRLWVKLLMQLPVASSG